MTPSQVAKSYGAKSVKEVAEFHGMTQRNVYRLFDTKLGPERFESMCWQWCKSQSPFAQHLSNAFIDGCSMFVDSLSTAKQIAKKQGYK